MPYIILHDGEKMIRYQVSHEVEKQCLKCLEKFNEEQKRECQRQAKEQDRHENRYSLDDILTEKLSDELPPYYRGQLLSVLSDPCSNVSSDFTAVQDILITIKDVLRTCTPAQRERFKLYMSGFKVAEIAKMQGCHHSAVEHSLQKILKKIKKSLE